MTTACLSVTDQLVLPDFSKGYDAKGGNYLSYVSNFVSKNKHKSLKLKKPAGAVLRITTLDQTIYKGKDDEVSGWGQFYLPRPVHMLVWGVVEGTSCPYGQLVLMTCENKRMYAYDGEELHEVSLDQLRDHVIEYPASKSYYNGEAFKDMTAKDWAVVKTSPEGKRLDKEHRKLVLAHKSEFLAKLHKI